MKALVLLVVFAGTAGAHPARFEDRLTVMPGCGLIYMQLDRQTGSGPAIVPAIVRTFDRFELEADYMLADWNTSQISARLQRFGGSARYQFGRVRVEPDREGMTLDAIVETGVGFERMDLDPSGAVVMRPDLQFGLGGRMLPNTASHGERVWFGMEFMTRLLLAPAPSGGVDAAFMFAFGAAVGR